jgi:hypothetical protein
VLFPSSLDSSSYKWRQGRVTDSLEYTLRVTIELNLCQLHPEGSTYLSRLLQAKSRVPDSLEHTAASLSS